MSDEVQGAPAEEAPEVAQPDAEPEALPVAPEPEPAAVPDASFQEEPPAPVDVEALRAERLAVANALNMATTAGLGDAAALQAVYDDLGAKLEALV